MRGTGVKRVAAQVVPRKLIPCDGNSPAADPFEGLKEDSPLKIMLERDRRLMLQALFIFAESMLDRGKSPHLKKLEQVAQVVAEASNLSARIQELLRDDHGEVLNQQLKASAGLPVLLDSFSVRVGALVYATGFKRQRAAADYPLIYASELARLRTGTWNDEHVAELLQTFREGEDDFSSDAIHKKRERFKASYPLFYRYVLQRVLKGEPCCGIKRTMRGRWLANL